MQRFITGLDVTLCQSPPSFPFFSTNFLPPTPSYSLILSHCLPPSSPHPVFPFSRLSFFLSFLSALPLRAVKTQALFVHKHASSWPLPLFTGVPGSCRPALCNSSALFVLPPTPPPPPNAQILFILAVDILLTGPSRVCRSSNTDAQTQLRTSNKALFAVVKDSHRPPPSHITPFQNQLFFFFYWLFALKFLNI